MLKTMVNLKIDNKDVCVKEGTTILEAARSVGIDIPTLCFLKEINEVGDCRMCIVEIEGRRGFATSCVQKVEEGMVVHTNTPNVIDSRRTILDLIVSNHNRDCLTCIRNGNCELQDLCNKFGIRKVQYEGEKLEHEIDDKSPSIVRDFSKCVLCRRCVATCKNVQNIGAIGSANRGFDSSISTTYGCSLNDVNCTFCGQCIEACPVGALHEKENIDEVWEKLKDEDTYVIVQTAPAVRVGLGEEFGMEIGTNVAGKMVTALKNLGFDKVFDTNTGADFTIMEEATEFVRRFKEKENIPMMTSCCPAWVKFTETEYPENIPNLSSCKSPHEMFGAILKTYYAEKMGIAPDKIYVVSVMPCVAKKYERQRDEMKVNGRWDVDAVITTRELARMIKQANINFTELEDKGFDNPMGEASGAAAIFGTTGGVMEAALRTAYELIIGEELKQVNFEDVRGAKGIKKATVKIGDAEVKVAVVHGLGNARKVSEEIKNGTADFDFLEVMACPGGCIMGGGQPIKSSKTRSQIDVRAKRAEALYSIDEKTTLRKSHENPQMLKIYEEYIGNPGEHKAHELLHTEYNKKMKYKI